VPGPGGCFVARLPADSGGGWLRLYRWIEGVPVDLADAGGAGRVGSLLGRLRELSTLVTLQAANR